MAFEEGRYKPKWEQYLKKTKQNKQKTKTHRTTTKTKKKPWKKSGPDKGLICFLIQAVLEVNFALEPYTKILFNTRKEDVNLLSV